MRFCPTAPVLVASERCSSPFQRIGTYRLLLIESEMVEKTWSPSFGAVTPGVMSDAVTAGARNEEMVWPLAARSMPLSRVAPAAKPISSRETVSRAS
jgi:hypothetical protein